MKPRVLHVTSEAVPFSKTGGLADVLGALPAALAAAGADVTVITPNYRTAMQQRPAVTRATEYMVPIGDRQVAVTLGEQLLGGVRYLFVDAPAVFDRAAPYGLDGADFFDNPFRFGLLCHVAAGIALREGFNVVHTHDWQSAATLALLAATPGGPVGVQTIHNLAFQGLCAPEWIRLASLPADGFHPGGYEFHGMVSLLKAGLVAADAVTTVSPTYAREITRPELGFGLDGVLRDDVPLLVGIRNGIGPEWNPSTDVLLPATYSVDDLSGKARCNTALIRRFGLDDVSLPLCGMVSRMTEQKGFDLLLPVLRDALRAGACRVALLGSGSPHYEDAVRALCREFPGRAAAVVGYDEELAHLIEAGSDLFLMPSRFEPCGMNQMYSMRYGTPPVVHAVGGLKDTVVDVDDHPDAGTGFVFDGWTATALDAALRRAFRRWHDRDAWLRLVRRGMRQDFSWTEPARDTLALYRQLMDGRTRP